MSLWKTLPRHLRVVLPLAGAYLGLLLAARFAFWATFAHWFGPLPAATLVRAIGIGARFDLRLTLIVLLPLALLGWVWRIGPVTSRAARRVWVAMLGVAMAATVVAYAVDFGHFAYLRTRLDARALTLLGGDAATALRMVWESYPVLWIALAAVLLAIGFGWLAASLARREAARRVEPRPRWRRNVLATLVVILWIGGLWGKLQWYPLRWSDAFFSTDEWASALALNPIVYFVDTSETNTAGYDVAAVRASYPLMARYLGIERPDAEKLTFSRDCAPRGGAGSKPNVVVIFLESLGSYLCGACGNPLDPTPNFDALTREGLFFRQYYVPAFGTARSVFAFLTGIPDVETHGTSTRNPLVVRQRTIVNAFAGYEKLYFLGGSLNWADIRGVLAHNIPDLRIFEEGSYAAPRVDAWGISDLALFEAANNELHRLGDKPFFAVIQTSGNHSPYNIPADSRGFAFVKRPQADLEASGFVSNDELNATRFLDHSLGWYFAAARREPYFANTIFILFGDHGYVRPVKHLPAETALGLTWFHVPLVIAGGALQRPHAVVDTLASEVDVLPTIASLAGVPYADTTLGRDLFDPRFDGGRFAFTFDYHFTVPRIGLIGDGLVAKGDIAGADFQFFDLASGAPRPGLARDEPGRARAMAELCRAIHQTARYLLYHNAPEDGPTHPQR